MVFIWSSTCFGQHTAHYQEPKTALVASGFLYVEGWWTCSWWTLSGTVWEGAEHSMRRCRAQYEKVLCTFSYCARQRPPATCPTAFHVWKTRGYQCSFRLLMTGGVLPETCWASYKYHVWNNIRRAQVKVGLINLCKGLFSLNARIYYKLKSGK